MSHCAEINFDGLIGPSHNYGGLSEGNIASQSNLHHPSNPKAAALQGLQKMNALMAQGMSQGFFLPQERPALHALRDLGFSGTDELMIKQAGNKSPHLLANVYSTSSMWAANAATYSPSCDTKDGFIHITPANLGSMLHRSLEPNFTKLQLELIFGKAGQVHEPIVFLPKHGDEGAANHLRISSNHSSPGFEIFVYGSKDYKDVGTMVLRQGKLASLAVADQHQLDSKKRFFLQQSRAAIEAGSFHNDIVSMANENLFIFHEQTFNDHSQLVSILNQLQSQVEGFQSIEIKAAEISLEDLVSSYLLNSQLVTLPSGEMLMLLPSEVQENDRCMTWLSQLSATSPIQHIQFVDIDQSMMNGGGPACLRFKAVVNREEWAQLDHRFLLTPPKLLALEALVSKHYRDQLNPRDLRDIKLMHESYAFLDELTQLLELGSFYQFQKI